jgi:hypothetical protein
MAFFEGKGCGCRVDDSAVEVRGWDGVCRCVPARCLIAAGELLDVRWGRCAGGEAGWCLEWTGVVGRDWWVAPVFECPAAGADIQTCR